jgi:hypothetical protein
MSTDARKALTDDSANTRQPQLALLGTSRRDYWMCQLAGWGWLCVVTVLGSLSGDTEAVIRFTLGKILCALFGLLLSHGWRGYLRRRGWLDRIDALPIGRLFAGLTVLAFIQSAVLLLVDQVFRGGGLLRNNPAWATDLALWYLLWLAVFFAWTLCYAVALSRRRAVRFELERLELEVGVKDAELRALQAQINPHFFFNCLNSIRALAYQDSEATGKAVSELAGLMRYTLQSGHAATAALSEELAAVKLYVELEKLHLEDRLRSEFDIQPGLDTVQVPRMLLQTLVENAIKHGVEPSVIAVGVRIAARSKDGMVTLEVSNDGALASHSPSTRLGLSNARRRLALLYGPAASLDLTEREGQVVATARFARPEDATSLGIRGQGTQVQS